MFPANAPTVTKAPAVEGTGKATPHTPTAAPQPFNPLDEAVTARATAHRRIAGLAPFDLPTTWTVVDLMAVAEQLDVAPRLLLPDAPCPTEEDIVKAARHRDLRVRQATLRKELEAIGRALRQVDDGGTVRGWRTAARIAGCSATTLRRLVEDDKLPAEKNPVDGWWEFARVDLETLDVRGGGHRDDEDLPT
jgi:hypothetical protein